MDENPPLPTYSVDNHPNHHHPHHGMVVQKRNRYRSIVAVLQRLPISVSSLRVVVKCDTPYHKEKLWTILSLLLFLSSSSSVPSSQPPLPQRPPRRRRSFRLNPLRMMMMMIFVVIILWTNVSSETHLTCAAFVTFHRTTTTTSINHHVNVVNKVLLLSSLSSSHHHQHSRFHIHKRTTRLHLDTTSTSLSSLIPKEHQPQLSHTNNEVLFNDNVTGVSPQESSNGSVKPPTNTMIANMNNNNNNNVDGVIRWKDVLRSTHPISCDLNDEECLKRQQQYNYDHNDNHVVVVNLDEGDATALKLSFHDQRNIALALLGTIGIITTMILQSGPGAYRYYLAGAICAMASHVIPVPIDTVKTRKQVDPTFAKLSFVTAFVKIWHQEGLPGLLAGLGPTAIGYALEGGIKFGVYEAMKPMVTTGLSHVAMMSSSPSSYLSFVQSRVVSFAICAAISGVAASIVLCPMEALRIRMVANPTKVQSSSTTTTTSQSNNSGWFRTAIRMIKTEGITSFVKGMEPMIYKQVPYTITKNVSFDIMTRYFYSTLQTTWQMTTIGPLTKFVVPFFAAATASILSCLSSQPGDVLLSLVNAQQHDVRRTRDIIRDVLHSEKGWKGFYIGTKARLLHVGIVVTLQLLIYDLVKRICGIAATGIVK